MSLTIVGLTGPTGAGKTTVLHVLEEMGAVVLDCDAIYHQLTSASLSMRMELEQRFGADIYDAQGMLQRKVLGAKVFEHPQALEDLNAITHRYVQQEVERQLNQARKQGKQVAVVDAIALIESGLAKVCHVTVAVVASAQVRMARIMARDGIDETYARMRVEAQKPALFFQQHCQYTLHNDGDNPEQLRKQAMALYAQILH